MVVIKDFGMPSCCSQCDLCVEDKYADMTCVLLGTDWEESNYNENHRDENCPLVEIEECKTGEWVYEYDNGVSAVYHCSVCGRKLVILRNDAVENYPYCHCGAEIKGCEDGLYKN